jgi:AbrB family looped-hinge helix DNA binding protein
METTRISSKGQVVIPQGLRKARQWDTGQELVVTLTDEGLLLTPKAPFAATVLDDVAGCLPVTGAAKTEQDIDAALQRAAKAAWRDRG